MRIDIVTVFPEMVIGTLNHSIIKRAMERRLVTINVVNLRDYTCDRHKTTDDIPYGGGGGMVMKIEPIARALHALTPSAKTEAGSNETEAVGIPYNEQNEAEADALQIAASQESARTRIILTDPRGPRFTQEIAQRWAQEAHIILLCGHYEGVDERVRQHLITDEISIGDYILTGGELPALIIADALTRLQPGALGDVEAPDKDTFSENLLEYPHYTRPREFSGWTVPDILLCGHHAQITRWRRWHQLHATQERRPDLFAKQNLSIQDQKLMASPEPTAPVDEKALRRAAYAGRSSEQAAEETEHSLQSQSNENYEKYEETDGNGI